MHNIILAIFFSSSLFLILKLFKIKNIDTFQAIVFNYITAFLIGQLHTAEKLNPIEYFQKPWLGASLLLGTLFVTIFYLIGKTVQTNGVSTASIACKISLIIPILFGFLFLKEKINITQLIGITFAFLAIYFSTKNDNKNNLKKLSIYPIFVFLGTGIIDTALNYFQKTIIPSTDTALFSSITFLNAFFVGAFYLSFLVLNKKTSLNIKNIIGGFILGVPNFYSIYYILRSLQIHSSQTNSVFTLLNIGIIITTSLFGLLIFGEKLKKTQYIGIIFALFALYLIT